MLTALRFLRQLLCWHRWEYEPDSEEVYVRCTKCKKLDFTFVP